MKNECLICGAPIKYLNQEKMMQCELCGKQEMSNCSCEAGHYICNECHTRGLESILTLCLNESSADPWEIIDKMMDMDFCHMHGPEHHVMVGCALLTAYKNAGGKIDLAAALKEMFKRGKAVPGGTCGFWGACGAAISAGMFVSIITKSTPLAELPWQLSNFMTSDALKHIASYGGPRCCKRNSGIAIMRAIRFVDMHLGVKMTESEHLCTRCEQNNQCIGKRCPFSPVRGDK